MTVTGSGARTLVLGNGFGTVQSIWAPIVEALALDHRVVTFDPAGCGAAEKAWQRSRHVRLEGYAEDLLGIIEDLDTDQVTYVGHSFSGMAGVLAANTEPALFERMILIGASARYLTSRNCPGPCPWISPPGPMDSPRSSWAIRISRTSPRGLLNR